MNNPRTWDAHVHVETSQTTPAAVLKLAREKGLRIALVDHVFQDEDRMTPVMIKSACQKSFSDVYFRHGCQADVYAVGKIDLTETQRLSMDFVILTFTRLERPGTLDGVDVASEVQVGSRLLELFRTAVDYPYTDIIAHPFSFSIEGIDSWKVMETIPQKVLREQLCRIREWGIAVEINARTLRANDAKPQEYFIDLANQQGCCFTVGSDAHSLEEVGQTQWAWELIQRLKIPVDRIVFPAK